MKMTNDFIFDPKEIRVRLGLNQQAFWTRIGVTQSGGSRYESGRRMPKPVRELLRLVHIERIDLSRINREDFDTLDYLKSHRPEVYQSARQEIAAKPTESVASIQSEMPPVPQPKKLPLALVRGTMPSENPEKIPLVAFCR